MPGVWTDYGFFLIWLYVGFTCVILTGMGVARLLETVGEVRTVNVVDLQPNPDMFPCTARQGYEHWSHAATDTVHTLQQTLVTRCNRHWSHAATKLKDGNRLRPSCTITDGDKGNRTEETLLVLVLFAIGAVLCTEEGDR